MVFDLLHLDGHSTMPLPYRQRREVLDKLDLDGPNWKLPAYHVGDGKAMLEASATQGLEGVVAKRLESPYVPGARNGTWIKVKNHLEQEFVVGGWLPGKGARSDSIGSLALGYYDDEESSNTPATSAPASPSRRWRTCSACWSRCARTRAPSMAASRRKRPSSSRPELIAEVRFGEWTRTRTVRHPSFKGLRDDKDPRDVSTGKESFG